MTEHTEKLRHMPRHARRLTRLAAGTLIVVWALVLGACATNPVTGSSDFVLMTEEQEIALGRETHPKILEAYSKYDDADLQEYVQRIGDRVATVSHRSDLVYRFTVVDSAEVNAFALPGGYIYITRGLLAYLDSEAQLAAVLGHEIGHVTARHAVRQHSAATATGILGAILASQVNVYGAGDVINVVGTALVRGYGRDHELEADRLGAEYLAKGDYDPDAMLDVIRVLKDQELFERELSKEEGREPKVYHGLFSTHPDNDKRLQEVVASANQWKSDTAVAANRDSFLAHLDGMTFGDSRREGVRRGNRFYHQPLNFALSFPEGWKIDNLPDRIVGRPPGHEAVLEVRLDDINRRIPPRQFMLDRLELEDLTHEEPLQVSQFKGHTAVTKVRTPFGKRQTRVAVLYVADQAYIFSGAAKDEKDPFRYDEQFKATVHSFHRLTPEERELSEPLKLRVVAAGTAETFAGLAQRSRIPNSPEAQLRLLNRYYPSGEPAPGRLIKLVN